MKKIILFVCFSLLFISCKKDNSGPPSGLFSVKPPRDTNDSSSEPYLDSGLFGAQKVTECNEKSKMKFVYDVMHDSYYWYDEVAVLTEKQIYAHGNDITLLNALKNKKDRFSYIMDIKSHDDYFVKGESKSFGFTPAVILDDNNHFKELAIQFVYPDSPMKEAGLKRGDKIVGVDGFEILDILRSQTLIDKYFDASTDDLTATFRLQDRNITVSKKSFKIKTVSTYNIVNFENKKVAYLHFKSFIGTSNKALDDVFKLFKENGVDELVLDLRYNGGGYVHVASHLATLIGGKYVYGRVLERTIFNAKYRKYDYDTKFEGYNKNALDLKRVFIIADGNTASASEIIINSLSAKDNAVEVIQIGTPTFGKPYGMIGGEYCDSYILPIQFAGVNADGFGEYDEGLSPLCRGYDSLNYELGDKRENMFSDALYYIKNGKCKEYYKKSRALGSKKSTTLTGGFRGLHGLY